MRKRMQTLVLTLLLLAAMTAPATGAGSPDAIQAPHVPETVLLQFKADAGPEARAAVMQAHGLVETGRIHGTDVIIAQGKGKSTAALTEALSRNPHVAYAEPDYIAEVFWTPNDPAFATQQWGTQKINSQGAWDFTTGSSTTLIAIVDSGIDLDHPDLATKVRTDIDYDFVNNDSEAQDDNGHGTHLAGTAAAATHNGIGIAGICPNCQLLPVKVINASGSGTYSAIANGITYAADKGAKVINLSLGASSGSSALLSALQYAYARGATLTCADGGSTTPSYPAYYSECVAVASSDQYDHLVGSAGAWVDTAAPGQSIYSTTYNNTYATYSGRSMATAHVSGLAGLLYSQGRTQADVRNRLTATTYTDPLHLVSAPRRINAFKAVALP